MTLAFNCAGAGIHNGLWANLATRIVSTAQSKLNALGRTSIRNDGWREVAMVVVGKQKQPLSNPFNAEDEVDHAATIDV